MIDDNVRGVRAMQADRMTCGLRVRGSTQWGSNGRGGVALQVRTLCCAANWCGTPRLFQRSTPNDRVWSAHSRANADAGWFT